MTKLNVTNPQNNELLSELHLSTAAEIKEMVSKAKAAQKDWARRSLYERAQILYRFADIYESNIDALAKTLALDMGKPIRMSMDEIAKVPQNIRSTIEYANHMYGAVLPDNDSDAVNDLIFTKRVPLGVIAGIIPFNYPVEATILKSVPALIMGNAVIIKAPSSNPLAVLMVKDYFVEAGVPEEIVPFIVCERSSSDEAITTNPDIAAISLTGSTAAGIQIARDSATYLKPLFFELGGNDAFIICKDVDIDEAVEEIYSGRCYNTGQTCIAPKRFLVERPIYDELLNKLVDRLRQIKIGDALDPETEMATLVSEKAAITIEEQVNQTLAEGAELALGGKREGAYYDPTVLTNVTRNMEIAKDLEVFGPVFPLIAFDTLEEAISIANQSSYALNAGVMSKDTLLAFRIANQLEAGTVVVNGNGSFRHLEQAHGGGKLSGLGREGVSSSLEEFSQIKNYVVKGAMSMSL